MERLIPEPSEKCKLAACKPEMDWIPAKAFSALNLTAGVSVWGRLFGFGWADELSPLFPQGVPAPSAVSANSAVGN